MCCKEYQPMRAKELAVLLQIPAGKREELHKILDMLLEEGKISINKRGRYEAVRNSTVKKEKETGKKQVKTERKKGQYYTGTFISHPRGFGFLEIPEEEEDIFIPEESVGTALHGDTVQIIVKKDGKDGKRCEGEVVKVLERGTREVVGTYQQCDGFGFVVTDNQRFLKDVFIPAGKSLTAEDGDKVLAEIKDHGNKRRSPEGKIIEILGKPGECGVDVLCVAKSYELPMEFPEKVAKQAERIKETLNEGDFYGREDLRDVVMVTIDGEDEKDLEIGRASCRERV